MMNSEVKCKREERSEVDEKKREIGDDGGDERNE